MKIDAGHAHADPCNEFQAGSRINDVPVPEVGYYRSRSPVKPVTVGELAGLDPGGQQKELLAWTKLFTAKGIDSNCGPIKSKQRF